MAATTAKSTARITVAVSEDLVARIEAFCGSAKKTHGVEVSISEAARTLITRGLDDWESSRKKRGMVR